MSMPSRKGVRNHLNALLKPFRKAPLFWALKDINFTLEKGAVLGVIGGSGSGKSTLLKLIAGVYSPNEGRIKVNGTVSDLLTSTSGFNIQHTGLENIYYYAKRARLRHKEIDTVSKDIIQLADIGESIGKPMRTYSFDMYAKLGFSIVTCLKQDVILIDEALEAGDEDFEQKSRDKIRELVAEHHTLVIISHHMDTIREFATEVIWLEDGRLAGQGEAKKITKLYRDFC